MGDPLFQFPNPFVRNPNFDTPESSNFIEKGISNGIENGFENLGNRILHAGQIKCQSLAESLPELASIALISYLIYLGYKSFFKNGTDIEAVFSKVYPAFMAYIVFKLFWRVVLKI